MNPLSFNTNTNKGQYKVSGELKQWVLNKLIENPKLYGGDLGNSAIQLAYIKEKHKGKEIESLELNEFAKLTSVSRAKNALLKQFPELDKRDKNKPREKS